MPPRRNQRAAAMSEVTVAFPRPAMILRLLAGRGAFRLGVQLMPVTLAGVWDADAFGLYASTVGLSMWLPLVVNAPEKAALKALPRCRRLAPQLARITVALSAAPVAVLLAVLAPVMALAPDSEAAAYLAAAAWLACTGLLMTLCGLHRLYGRASTDALAFAANGVTVLAATAVTWLAGWTPQFHLTTLAAGCALVTAWTLATLPKAVTRPERRLRRRGLVRRLARSTVLLGGSEVLDTLSFSLVYLALAVSGQVAESGTLYLVLLPATAIAQLANYLLRMAQPGTSARLRGAGRAEGDARAAGLLRLGERLGLAFAVLWSVLLLVPGTRELLLTGIGRWVALGALALLVLALFLIVRYAVHLLENTTDRAAAHTSTTALIGVLAAGLLAAALAPALGAVGGLTALALAIAARAGVLRRTQRTYSTEP
ncbi:hypothetical protein [Acrocarpospora sp. B8E8]|uniref:hypothetical protein n=1 Tax=Acrocarpospora sp. B8E8 TaxID=3153572 RepID=UPI00325DEB3E